MKPITRTTTVLSSVVLMALACAVVEAQLPEGYVLNDALKTQFTLALPAGWMSSDQGQRMRQLGGRIPEGFGLVYFSSVNVAEAFGPFEKGQEEQGQKSLDVLRQIDTGALPAFFVDRRRAEKGMSCRSLTAKASQKVYDMIKDSDFGKGTKTVEPLRVDSVAIGGCQGASFRGRVQNRNGAEWVIDVQAVSDGTVLYLFSLRNRTEHFDKNFPVYQTAMSTLRLTVADSTH